MAVGCRGNGIRDFVNEDFVFRNATGQLDTVENFLLEFFNAEDFLVELWLAVSQARAQVRSWGQAKNDARSLEFLGVGNCGGENVVHFLIPFKRRSSAFP